VAAGLLLLAVAAFIFSPRPAQAQSTPTKPSVILATGGFQSNLDMVRASWPADLPFPDRLLAGSGIDSVGLRHELAREAGAALFNMHRQWNYATGLPDPRRPGGKWGLHALNEGSIWVNTQGRRFMCEYASPKESFPILVNQTPATYWAVFDEASKPLFLVSGSDWVDFLRTAQDRRAAVLCDSVLPHDAQEHGGVAIDMSCRALDSRERPIPGLYAVGELAGLAGINGKAALEGTFLGPCVLTGRVAGRSAVADFGIEPQAAAASKTDAESGGDEAQPAQPAAAVAKLACTDCHVMQALPAVPREGYRHFEKAHGVVVDRRYDCPMCHAELQPFRLETHRVDPLNLLQTCAICHGVKK
jgi:succinate dehydrogenase/fumarate reductase flavoprotein subunit